MIEVFVVRQLDIDGLPVIPGVANFYGVYSDFWKALAAAKANQEKNFGHPIRDPGYTLGIHGPSENNTYRKELWCEVTKEGVGQSIYYTINKLELDA